MEATWVESDFARSMEQRWSKMIFLSLAFHLAIFSAIFFIPQEIPTRKIVGEVYEVSLVEMPGSRSLKPKSSVKTKSRKRLTVSKKAAHAKRISRPKKKKKPIAIAKRTITTKRKKPKKQEESSSRLLDKALSRIEKTVKDQEKKDRIEQTISKLQSQVKGTGEKGVVAQNTYNGITIRLYQVEVENWIKSHWSYPVALFRPKNRKDLEAIVLIQVKSSGVILKFRFKNRSSSVIFDQSILKALEMSDPLPPFPEGYRRTEEEIEINFNLRDLAVD